MQCPYWVLGFLLTMILLHAKRDHQELARVVHALLVKERSTQLAGNCLNDLRQRFYITGVEHQSVESFISLPGFARQCQDLCKCMLAVVALIDEPLAEKAGKRF